MKTFWKRVLFVLLFVGVAFATTAGPNFPTAATGNTTTNGGGTRAWTTPTRIETQDTLETTVGFTANLQKSDDLIGTGFGFSIPAGATINGIQVDIGEHDVTGQGDILESIIQLTKNGTNVVGTNKAANTFPASLTNFTFGSGSDLWGATWTASEINASTFGVVLVARCSGFVGPTDTGGVDYMKITVAYTPAASSSGFLQLFSRNTPKAQTQTVRVRIS